MAILFIVLDGLGDRVYEGATPLERAKTPNIDSLLKKARTGIMDVLSPGVPPGSDTGHWALLGYEEGSPGRGVFEAYGHGFPVAKGDVVFRANLAQVEKTGEGYIVKKRRKNGDWSKLEVLNVNGVEVRAVPTLEHRGVVITKGSRALTDSDPGKTEMPVAKILAKDGSAKKTAELMNAYMEKVYETFGDGTFLLLRGAGSLTDAPSFLDRWGLRAACVAGGPLYKGVACYVGMKLLDAEGALGTIHSNFSAKYRTAVAALDEYDFVFLHIKATDEASHMKNPELKTEMFEKIDAAFSGIDSLDATVVITGDHSTPSFGPSHHSGDPVPVLLAGKNIIPDDTPTFNEKTAAKGALGRIKATSLLPILLDAEDKSKEVSFSLSVPEKQYFCDYEPL